MIADGDHEPTAKTVPHGSWIDALSRVEKSAGFDRLFGESLFGNAPAKLQSAHGREADLELICDGDLELPSLGPVFANPLSAFVAYMEGFMVIARDKFVQFEEFLSQGPVFARPATFLVFKFNAESLSELLHCFHEVESLGFHDKAYDVTGISSGKALVNPFVGRDEKRRCLLVGERAESLVVGTCSFEGYFTGNYIEDSNPIFEIANTARLNRWHGWGGRDPVRFYLPR